MGVRRPEVVCNKFLLENDSKFYPGLDDCEKGKFHYFGKK